MGANSDQSRAALTGLDRAALQQHQLLKLNSLLYEVLPHNEFYANKFAGIELPLQSLDELSNLSFTEKDELAGDDLEGFAANRTFELARYTRFHQTSGTKGRPLIVLDTPDDWQWWLNGWQFVLDAAEVTAHDVCMMAFSFGPFIGFWSAFEAAVARGCLVIPGGGLSTQARLDRMKTAAATCLFCTPSYALRMAEVAAAENFDVRQLSVNKLILAGEPGGSVPAIRERLNKIWNARVLDHSGATEIGPWGFGNLNEPGLHVNEASFIAEFLPVESDKDKSSADSPAGQAAEGQLAELVLTTLGRSGSPVIRYRTGDRVQPIWNHDRDVRFVWLDGGVLGRADDMMIIRGINIFPSSVEQILRSLPEIDEYRMTATRQGEMDQLLVEVEDRADDPRRVADELQLRLGLRVEVRSVPPESLPRFEAKGKRFIDKRQS